jgi:LacI family transcriptional regulator
MADVAAKAGVSVSTVSHVLNRTRPVSKELSEKVHLAMEATGYSRNALAHSLATSTTTILGMVMSATWNPFFAPLFSAMEEAARLDGYTVLLADSHDDLDLEASQVRIMLDHQVAGLVLAPAAAAPAAILDLLHARKVPTTLVDRFADDRFNQVGAENVEATAGLVSHLIELGHTRIGFIAGSPGLSTSAERLAGYRLSLKRAGLRFDARLVRDGGSRAGTAHAAALDLLAMRKPPTAIVSGNNSMTLGALRALREAPVQIPGDVAFVAYDDVEWGELIQPGLTAIRQPIAEIGRRAVAMLLGQIRDPGGPVRHQRLEPVLAHRESCGCHPVSRPATGELSVCRDGKGTRHIRWHLLGCAG